MKDNKRKRFYFKFVSLVFCAILATYLVFTLIVLVCIKLHFITMSSRFMSPAVFLIFFMVAALILGLIVASLMARFFLRPINTLSDATKKVAKGDFSVQIKTSLSEESEMGELIGNFNKMTNDLRRMETLKNDFIANVSHEFKTPLATIQGYSTLLQDENLSPSEREAYTRYIIDATKQLSTLTSNILKLSKLENSETDLTKTRFDAAEQIRQAILFLETQWAIKNIDMDIDLAPAEVYLSEELMMQVWLNLVGNAVKFSDYAGKIIIRGEKENRAYKVTIKDYGCGMNDETRARLFEKFYQGDNSRSREGNGLGLTLVKKILDISGGNIFVESEEGKGSEFTVELPLEQ
ncbi:MAG: HAMP domain-containing protein [Clostridia bacterium]|nr:HAMP domain-containing protein [Clostridia bacterium]